jgi:general secretion pathway protein N
VTGRLNMLRLSLAASLAAVAGQVGSPLAATPTTIDALSPSVVTPIEIIPDKPPPAATMPPSGNPLWAIPLSMLSATRERPIFLPTRRPPAPVIAAPLATPSAPTLSGPAEPTRPPLALVGAVVGESDAIAIFIDQTTKAVVRLKTGQDHDGWVLSSVKGREATLQKDQLIAVFALPVPNSAGAPGAPITPSAAVVVPSGGDAPFVPRSTPKNGESDGL